MSLVHGNNQIVTGGLVLYLDAGNPKSYSGSGTVWNDLTGNNRNFTWNTTPTFTSDGLASYFSTNGKKCTGPASDSFGINNTSGYTVILVAMQNALVDSSAFKFYSSGGAANASTSRGIFSHCTWSDNNVYFDQGGCCNADTRTSVASGGSQTWNMWGFRRVTNSSTRHILKNGVVLATNTNAAANINLTTTGVDLGGTSEGTTWNARLNAFLAYNRDLSNDEMVQNFNVIRKRFGL